MSYASTSVSVSSQHLNMTFIDHWLFTLTFVLTNIYVEIIIDKQFCSVDQVSFIITCLVS